MIAGHFGLAAGVKAKEPQVPLWALMLSTQLLDVIFVPLLVMGVETFDHIPGAPSYGGSIIHADYTHSFVGALIIAALAGLIASRFWGRRGGWVIGGVVFSHWILDLLVHRGDMPILPGNLGNLPRLGFGLWATPALAATLEAALILVGGYMYFRAATGRPVESVIASERAAMRQRAVTAASVTGLLLVLTLVSDLVGVG